MEPDIQNGTKFCELNHTRNNSIGISFSQIKTGRGLLLWSLYQTDGGKHTKCEVGGIGQERWRGGMKSDRLPG